MQIELMSFSWTLKVEHKEKPGKKGLLATAGAMAGGAAAGVGAGLLGGQAGLAVAAAAAATASAIKDFKDVPMVELGVLTLQKRFDISSARIQSCVDNDIPIHSALISVLHIKQGARSIHEPGFTLLATDGYFVKADIKMDKGDKGVEVIEDLELHFKNIIITYSKRLGVDNIPMPPFVYVAPKAKPGGVPGL